MRASGIMEFHRRSFRSAFARMAAAEDDALLIPDTMEHDWDKDAWEW